MITLAKLNLIITLYSTIIKFLLSKLENENYQSGQTKSNLDVNKLISEERRVWLGLKVSSSVGV